MSENTSTGPIEKGPESAQATIAVIAYQATVQHWCHAEQIRWTLLYNYLMASTILLLAWATVFASAAGNTPVVGRVLVILSGAGILLSVVWMALGWRASDFVHTYATNGKKFEEVLFPKQPEDAARAPFTGADQYRDGRAWMKRLTWWAKSRYVVVGVPAMFLLIYLFLICVSIWK